MPLPRHQNHGPDDQQERDARAPGWGFTEEEVRENDEDGDRDDLLNDLDLRGSEPAEAVAVGGDLQGILGQGDEPTDEDRRSQRRFPELQVPVPGHRHERVGQNQQQYGLH